MRPFLSALAAALVALPTVAQPLPGAHAVPFGSSGNAVELELVAPDGAALGDHPEVSVTAAPLWLQFPTGRVATGPADGPPVARVVFDVLREAPVGQPAEVAFEVRSGGAVVARHTVRVEVAAPPLALDLPHPNPAQGSVTVPFTVGVAGPVRLSLYDVLGREVAVLADGIREPGAHEARADVGALAASVYVVRLTASGMAGPASKVRRLTVVR